MQKKKKIPLHITNNINSNQTLKWISNNNPDWLLVIGWSYLLKRAILKKYQNKIIGYHPSSLPNNRGRHPLIWSVFLNLKEIGSCFFLINKNIDDGKIISKRIVSNVQNKSMKNIYFLIIKTAQKQVKDIVSFMKSKKKIVSIKKKGGNIWRKRSFEDGKIDWRMNSKSICNLVNALSWPYQNAHSFYKGKYFKIIKIRQMKKNFIHNYEPGKIIDVKKKFFPLVKSYDGIIEILEYSPLIKFKKEEYLN